MPLSCPLFATVYIDVDVCRTFAFEARDNYWLHYLSFGARVDVGSGRATAPDDWGTQRVPATFPPGKINPEQISSF